jgi:dTDP-4-dehydrorhamnose reductase
MKILLLGHKGMLGNDLLIQLAMRHDIIGMDKEEIDITSAAECRKAIEGSNPDIIVNEIGRAHV